MPWRLAFVVESYEELCRAMESHLRADPSGQTPVFAGAPTDSAAVAAFTTGKAGEAVLETFLRERDLENLALFWSKGGRIPWSRLCKERRARKVPLPGYPFNRQRYWVPPSWEEIATQTLDESVVAPSRRGEIVLPRTQLEAGVQGIWCEVLGYPEIGVFDRFLELGGTSLAAVRVAARLKELFQLDIAIPVLLSPEVTVVKLTEVIVAELARQVAAESTIA
jgi:acyl transferase domain-containing protein